MKRGWTFKFKLFPFLAWFPLVSRSTVKADILAGLTGAIIVLPQGVAFAMIAGLPPEYGLYTAIVPPIVAAFFGSSYHLISGPTTAISIVVFAVISPLAEPGSAAFIQMALTLTFMAGLIQFTLGCARMGALVNFISHSVVVGFTAGAAILIATSQIKYLIGVTIPAGESFLHTWIDLARMVTQANPMVMAVGAVTLVTVVAIRIYNPRWPGMLVAMAAGSITAALIGSQEHNIQLVGALPASLPPLSHPDFSLSSLKTLTSGALAVSLLGLIEAVSISRSVAMKSRQRIASSQEFIGQGLANIIGCFFSSYASSGSFTRSGVNYTAGAKTPMAAVFAALSLALILLVVAPLAAYLPMPAMGAIVLVVAYNLIDSNHILSIFKSSRSDSTVMVTTFLSTLFVELEFAIYVGVLLSLVFYLTKTSQPKIVTRVPDPKLPNRSFVTDSTLPECPQIKIIRIDGSLYFGSVNHVEEAFLWIDQEDPEQVHRLIVCSGVNFVDVAGAVSLANEAERLREKGGRLYLYGLKEGVMRVLRGVYLEKIGRENIFTSKREAIKAIIARIDHDRCEHCSKRIFKECASFPFKGELAAGEKG